MKQVVFFSVVLAVAAVAGCKNNNNAPFMLSGSSEAALHQADTANYTTIQWIDSVKDFGTVPHGDKVKMVFHFLNSGNKPLYISTVRPGCGCTLADYTKSAVLPGQRGEVTAEYDSNHGQPGQQVTKYVYVTCNAKNSRSSTLIFRGTIKAKS
jgi:hypothetical protein